LVIVGSEGPETKSLYGQVRRHSLADHVSFINKIADEELCWLYRYCEAVLVSSTIEGFCLPVVEAQQCGARVVCSDIPVLREVGGADCRFVSLAGSNSALEFARAIASALHRRKPQPQTDRRFSPHEIARQHVALYRALLAGASEEKISATANVGWVSPRRHAV
jgi:glycosyltransferase involved in cell wall biosynthesis